MKQTNLYRRILAGALSLLMCGAMLPAPAFAADSNPYDITITEGNATVEVLSEESADYGAIQEAAEERNLGIHWPGLGFYKDYGQLFSPFTMTSSSSIVSFTMTTPDLPKDSMEAAVAEALGKVFRIAVQNAEDPSAPVIFYPAEEVNDGTLSITIPVNGTVNCALAQFDTEWFNGTGQQGVPESANPVFVEKNETEQPVEILENREDSTLSYTWTYRIGENARDDVAGVTDSMESYVRVLLPSPLSLDTTSIDIDSSVFSKGSVEEESSQSWIIQLIPETDRISEEELESDIVISFDAVLPYEDFNVGQEFVISTEIVMKRWQTSELSGVSYALSETAPLQSIEATSAVTIKPANMTIYQGGDEGYEGVYDDGQPMGSDSLPHPLFEITPASGSSVDPEELTFTNGGKSWNVVGTGDPDLYYFEPAGEHQDPVRVTYTDQDGNSVTNDEFKVENVGNTYAEYAIDLYPGENDLSEVKATAGKEEWSISVNSGTLTVRAVENKNDPTSDIVATEPTSAVKENKAVAVAPAGTTYTLNDTGVQIPEVASDSNPDGSKPSLLFDEIITSDGVDRIDALKDAVDTKLRTTNGTRHYEAKYLDLVDANNGNAWIKASKPVTIYWGYPKDTDQNTTFKLLHFEDLHRDTSGGDTTGFNPGDIAKSTIDDVEVNTTANGISFTVGSGGFSPFVLVWETAAEEPDPGTDPNPGGGGGDSHSDPTGNLTISLGGNGGNEDFIFTVIFTDEDGDELENNFYYNGDYTGTIGSGDEITLEGGEKIVIRNLPEGTRYEVIIETADGYTYVIDGEEGVIHTGMNEAEFTATRTVPVADPSVTGVSRWLNTTDHIAYLTGYPGGAFGPDNNMTRAEVAQMFYALLNNKNVTITKTFPDVPADAWYATAVNTLASLGMVSGDENGNYRPNDPITRAEFCVIALAFAYEPENAVCYFGDVSRSDWFYTYVAQAASYGWIGGYTNGNFGPNDRITRAQVTTIVNNMLGRAADRDYVIDHQADLVQFTDLTRAHWGYFQIMEATNAHNYTKSNGTESWR